MASSSVKERKEKKDQDNFPGKEEKHILPLEFTHEWVYKHQKLFLTKMINYLRELEDLSARTPSIFIDGEFDSMQTTFERLSNQVRIGVLAKRKTVGYAMLRILRMIVDTNPCLIDLPFYDCSENESNEKEAQMKLGEGEETRAAETGEEKSDIAQTMTMKQLVKSFAQDETEYTHIFSGSSLELCVELCVEPTGHYISRSRELVNLFDLDKLEANLDHIWSDKDSEDKYRRWCIPTRLPELGDAYTYEELSDDDF